MTAPIAPMSFAPKPAFLIEQATGNPLDEWAKVVYLGGPKDGKTYLTTTWNQCAAPAAEGEEAGPGCFGILVDPNVGTWRAERPAMPYVVIDKTEQLRGQILPWIQSGGLKAAFPTVRTVVFDSISFYAQKLEIETNGDWQTFAGRMSADLAEFTRLGNPNTGFPQLYHWVATCHEKDRYTTTKTAGGRERHLVGIEPAIAGKMASLVTGYFDVVLYAQKKTEAVETQGPNGGKVFVQTPRYTCSAIAPPNHTAPAGGKLWGVSVTGADIDGTYEGLRAYCTAKLEAQP